MKKDNSKRHQFFNSPMPFERDFHPNTQRVINPKKKKEKLCDQ
jgi:hypothetical protein